MPYVGLFFLRGAYVFLDAYVFFGAYVVFTTISPSKHDHVNSYFWPHMQDGRRAGLGGRRGPPDETKRTGRATPPASINSAALGLPPIAGAALLLSASSAMANPAAMPRLPRSPAAKLRIKPKPATHRRIKVPLPEGSLPHCKNSLAEPFAILENAILSVQSNITDMDDVADITIVR
jgi:hypothetical protein